MDFTLYQVFLAITLTTSGSVNILAAKWMDRIQAMSYDGILRPFEHPFLQVDLFFLGQIMCLIFFWIFYKHLKRKRGDLVTIHPFTKGSTTFNPFILCPPAVLDMAATTLNLFGLTMTSPSSYQMLRGSIVFFTALISTCIFRKLPSLREIIGIFFIVCALVIIGLADTLYKDNDEQYENQFLGDSLIVLGEFVAASQYVYEEVFVVKMDIPPLLTVGWEGIFGFIVLSTVIIPLTITPLPEFLHGRNPTNTVENVKDALAQTQNHPLIIVPAILLFTSICFYNFSGISITKEINSTTRVVLDTARVLIVWVFAICMSWQRFHYLQVSC